MQVESRVSPLALRPEGEEVRLAGAHLAGRLVYPQFGRQPGVGFESHVGDQPISLPRPLLAVHHGHHLHALVRAGTHHLVNLGVGVVFQVGVAPGGQGVRLRRQAVAVAERVVGDAGQGGGPRPAGQPCHPRRRVFFGQVGERANCRGGRVPAADDHRVLADVLRLLRPEHVFQPVGEVRATGQFAKRRHTAVAHPVRPGVGAGAVQHHVGGVNRLAVVGGAHEQAERRQFGGGVRLPPPEPADRDDGVLRLDVGFDRGRFGDGQQVRVAELAAGLKVGLGGNLAAELLESFLAERAGVHPERGEHFHEPPAVHVLAGLPLLEHGERQVQALRVQSRFDAHRPAADDRNAGAGGFGHGVRAK